MLTVGLGLAVSASASDLHPLGRPLPTGTVQLRVRDLGSDGEPVGVEATYRPARERHVRTERHFHLFDWSVWGRPQNRVSVQRETSHIVRHQARTTDGSLSVALALHDPEPGYDDYHLAAVRLLGGRAHALTFGRWFAETPALDPAFRLDCSADALRGVVRPTGLMAAPLHGDLPLWPALRTIDLAVAPVAFPTVQVLDPMERHYWDGWRQTSPQDFPGGRSVVLRHVDAPTVWRTFEYFAVPPAGTPVVTQPVPPDGTLPGVGVEVFWPDGETLRIPAARIEGRLETLAFPLARVTATAREVLQQSVVARAGIEPGSVSAAEWAALRTLDEPPATHPVRISLEPAAHGRADLLLQRRSLTEPWLWVLGVTYADERRAVTALVVTPRPWNGPVPD